MTMDDFQGASISCTLTTEPLQNGTSTTSGIAKKTVVKNASVHLLRNEFKDILIQVRQLPPSKMTPTTYPVSNVNIHKKFIKEGKASIHLVNANLMLMLSNCPPNNLAFFIKTLMVKLQKTSSKGLSQRDRLLSEKRRTLQEISPLTALDTQNAKKVKPNCPATPTTTKNGLKMRKPLNVNNQKPTTLKKTHSGSFTFTSEQKSVVDAVLSGQNVFFTGSAGTGKSYLLKKLIGLLPPDVTTVTASTGVAACHIGGVTLHSFAGIGSGNAALEQCIELARRSWASAQWKKCQHLIIDEISMVDGEFFRKLERIARIIRNNKYPFGGIQLILCGDFLQLPPVTKGQERTKFCFQVDSWDKCQFRTIELKAVHRQSDPEFIEILQNARLGRCSPSMAARLSKTLENDIEKGGIVATRLCTHKIDAETINRQQLDNLTETQKTYKAMDSDPQLVKYLNDHCPVSDEIVLKLGTQIMLCKNISIQQGLVNGARGVVIGFEPGSQGLPIVKLLNGNEIKISFEKWMVKCQGGIILTRRQLPIALAWAISIHKSQGMTLDFVEISLAKVFEDGQAYVALSRAKSLEGLRLLDFNSSCIRANRDVLRFYRDMIAMMPIPLGRLPSR